MATILADNFNRVGATLGPGWTEHVGNFSTDGNKAQLDANGLSIATVNASNQADQFAQCWCQAPDVNNNSGVVWRYQGPALFYYITGDSGIFNVWRRDGGGFNFLGAIAGGLGVATWRRLAVRMVGTQIDIFLDNNYDLAREGPVFRIVDAVIVGAGRCGIISSGNTATGAAGPLWDGFHCFDGGAQTIYVDVNAAGQTLGTQSDPDGAVGMGMNSAGLGHNGTLKILTDGGTPIGSPAAGYKIGHAGKFSLAGGESFPGYAEDTGEESTANNANLTIEGTDSAVRTLLRETHNRSYFEVRNDATFVLFREMDWDCTGGIGSSFVQTIPANNLGAPTEHSIAVDKCNIQLATPAVDSQVGVNIGADATEVKMRYCYGTVRAGRFGSAWLRLSVGIVVSSVMTRRNVFTGQVRRGLYCQAGPPAGALWDFDHHTYIDLNSGAHVVACLEVANGALVQGTIEHQNCIMASRGVNQVEFGTRVTLNPGAIVGQVLAHHNGYHGIVTERDVGVTDGGNELDGLDPAFIAEGTPFSWAQTAGSTAILLPSDWRPAAPAYLETADDAFNGIVLDRGALEVFPLPPEPPWTTITRRQADYCVRVIYASDDPLARAVSARLLSARPITHSKDILFRKYKVSDTSITIWDEEGYFITGGPNSLVDDADGRPDWYGRECTITLQESFGGPDLFTFVGFLIGLKSEAGKATLRLTSRFQRLLMKPFLANDAGKMVDVDGETGVAGDPPTAAAFLSDITPNAAAGCLVETWKFTFLGPTDFSIQGSQTGNDGRGTTGVDFTSDSGRVTVLAADWDITAGAFVAGDECSIKTVYRYAATTTVTAFQETLTNALAGGLTAAEIHPSLATFVGTIVDQRLGPFGLVIDDQMTVLRALEMIALHMLAVAVEFTDARIGMYAYVPTVTTVDTIFCKGTDLIKATIGHTPVYNVFNYEHTYIEKDEEYDGLEGFPDTDADNASFLKYGVKLEAPQQPKLKGFGEGNVSWIRTLARQNYERWAWPRRIFNLDLKVSRMTIEMDELFELQSSNPTVDVVGIEPAKISRTISPSIALSGEFFDASFYLQLEGACGYAFTERGHLMDNCWVVF